MNIGRGKVAAVDRLITVMNARMEEEVEAISVREDLNLSPPEAVYFVKNTEHIQKFRTPHHVSAYVVSASPRRRNARTSASAGTKGHLGELTFEIIIVFDFRDSTIGRWGRTLTHDEVTGLIAEFYSEAVINTIYKHAVGTDGAIQSVELIREQNDIDLATESTPESGTVITEWLLKQQTEIPTELFEV